MIFFLKFCHFPLKNLYIIVKGKVARCPFWRIEVLLQGVVMDATTVHPESNYPLGFHPMRADQEIAQSERITMAYRRLANAMILSTLREISKMESEILCKDSPPEIVFVESPRIDPWCELAGLEPEVVRQAVRRLVEQKSF